VDASANYPAFAAPYDVGVLIITSRTFPSFREAAIVAQAVAPNVQGNYHLTGNSSPAYDAANPNDPGATPSPATIVHDVDGQTRVKRYEIGADDLLNP